MTALGIVLAHLAGDYLIQSMAAQASGQYLRVTMCQISPWDTLNSAASIRWDTWGARYRLRISRTWEAVSLALPCSSPRGTSSGRCRDQWRSPRTMSSGRICVQCRPLSTTSLAFSPAVPGSRWRGLQQGRLSQRCLIIGRPAGGSPKVRMYAKRCARTTSRPSAFRVRQKTPYPCDSRPPIQGQQAFGPPLVSTRRQNESMSAGRNQARDVTVMVLTVVGEVR